MLEIPIEFRLSRHAVTERVQKMNYSRHRCVILSFIRRCGRDKNKVQLDVIGKGDNYRWLSAAHKTDY